MKLDLTGKKAIVCGSTRGIGWAAARLLAECGCDVVLLARNEQSLRGRVEELNTNFDGNHDYLCANFSHPQQVAEAVRDYLSNKGPIQILVNNTGGPPAGPAIDALPEDYLSAFNQHLICNQILVKAVTDGMKESGYGRIINIISTSVKQPIPGLGVSNTTRGAVASWAKTLSAELGPYGITVNNVLPGATRTDRLQAVIESRAKSSDRTVEDVEQAFLQSIPLRRFAEPQEVAAAVAFLASPAAAYISGVSIAVDGGRTTCL